jgi:hypothetical protein
MATKIFNYKKLLIIISIIIVLFLVIFLPVYFLVIKKSSSSSSTLSQYDHSPKPELPSPCSNGMVTFPDQSNNLIKNNMIEIEMPNDLKSIKGMSYFLNILTNTTTTKPCYVSWFNTENNFNTLHNNKQHYIKTININNNKIIITFEETKLDDTNPFPLHIHYFYNCIDNINSCEQLKITYPPL